MLKCPFLFFSLAPLVLMTACGTTSTPKPHKISPKKESSPVTDLDQTSQETLKKITSFASHTPTYCGYDFAAEDDFATITSISKNFANNWQSLSAYKKSTVKDRYYYDGFRIDLADGLFTDLKLHFNLAIGASGTKEVFVFTEISSEKNIAEYFLSKPIPLKDGKESRLLVLSTPDSSMLCHAVGFRFEQENNVKKLYATKPIATNPSVNAKDLTSIEDFFESHGLSQTYQNKD